MRNPLGLRIATTTLAGVMVISMVACGKTDEPVSPPVPATTVGTEIDDTVTTARVKKALVEDAEIKSFDFKVETRKGEVMLSGFVDNQRQIDRALEVTRGIEGVAKVDHNLVVKK
ncbi:MAG: hypothetical protein AUJ20_12620 [Comamonadaceae bacterium CG1_02_60_18]|nr:MAG: hypothetical protein AUJ20_12620 [Comamonadaceae bacterium CG1_02_60_18]PIQ50725.1 MAG: hypothetical protein COW02_19130 [Comamonadaceae bacterium CG12_big_fil_rev_8_21_14_0_65_59_15]